MTALKRPRILLVEDEVLISWHLSQELEASGFEVVGPCQSVSLALAQLDIPDCCDLAILDAHLSDGNAVPVAKILTQLAIPFFVVTGYSRGQLPEELAVAPAFTKPLDTQNLISQIRASMAL